MATALQALRLHARRWGVGACLGVGVAVATASGCTGQIGDAGSTGPGGGAGSGSSGAGGTGASVVTSADGPASFACNPNAKPAMDQIRALTSRQYLNTIADLIAALDPTTDPKCIDFLEKREGRPDRTLEGVYKIDGDKLQIAFSVLKEGKNRPTSFEKPGDRAFVWTFKRVRE